VIRFGVMVLLGWTILAIMHRRKGFVLLPSPSDRRRIALAGGIGFFGYLYGFSFGLRYTSAFSSSLLTGMSSLFVALLLWATRAERLTGRHVMSMILGFGGAVVFIVGRNGGHVSFKIGDIVSLIAAFMYAAYLVINRPLLSKYPVISLTTWSSTVGFAVLLVVAGPSVSRQAWSDVDAVAWVSMIWAVLIPVFLSWTVWAWVNKHVGVARPSLFLMLVPVVSGVAAWGFLNEQVRLLQLVGLALVLAALALGRPRKLQPAIPNHGDQPTPASVDEDHA
jgi:drug/metabolite transporter (DMT)-like permease